jgi:lipoic acid synthetase
LNDQKRSAGQRKKLNGYLDCDAPGGARCAFDRSGAQRLGRGETQWRCRVEKLDASAHEKLRNEPKSPHLHDSARRRDLLASARFPTLATSEQFMSASVSLNILSVPSASASTLGRKPPWLKMKMPAGPEYAKLMKLVTDQQLHTVCQSAKCPNMGECWAAGTATLMILGDVCTRSCGFCHIATGKPPTLDLDEPRRVGEAVATMNLKHVVITSVNRDELPDGGAGLWAQTIRQIRTKSPGTNVEVLIPDFCGDWDALQLVLDEGPEILNHNIETVPRLYKRVRPQAKYTRSLKLLQIASQQGLVTKTGAMLGLGETEDELDAVLDDLVAIGCQILTLGQYLQPTSHHLPVERWVHPDEFTRWKIRGEAKGLRHVESGPLVRSSYHAEKQVLSHAATR